MSTIEFISWSLMPAEDDTRVLPQELTCIICFESNETKACDWHHCKTCSAVWCDSCMEAMYYTARDHEDQDVELSCPQCRGSIANMQLTQRLNRWMSASPNGIGCSEEVAHELIAYENLVSSTVNLCECEDDGQPYFMRPPREVARIMSRDEICYVVEAKQGQQALQALSRMLRAEVRHRPHWDVTHSRP